jgi:hypothetical protein
MKYANSLNITIVAALAMIAGYTLSALWLGSVIILALGLVWLVGQQRQVKWLVDLGLIAFTAIAAFGVWWSVAAGWMLFGTVAALAAWDLAHFARRLEQADQVAAEARLRQAHLQQLLLIVGLGFGLGGVALGIQLKMNLGWGIALGLLVTIGLSRVLGSVKNENNQEEQK